MGHPLILLLAVFLRRELHAAGFVYPRPVYFTFTSLLLMRALSDDDDTQAVHVPLYSWCPLPHTRRTCSLSSHIACSFHSSSSCFRPRSLSFIGGRVSAKAWLHPSTSGYSAPVLALSASATGSVHVDLKVRSQSMPIILKPQLFLRLTSCCLRRQVARACSCGNLTNRLRSAP
jgi:hypothetical protein